MKNLLDKYYIGLEDSLINSLEKIEQNKQGFVLVIYYDRVVGTITDGDIRRVIINQKKVNLRVKDFINQNFTYIHPSDSLERVIDLFKDEKFSFLPIVDENQKLINVITKKNLHALLLLDIEYDSNYDFPSLDDQLVDFEVFGRPWGFYKTTFMNDFSQAKIIKVNPKSRLSLQKHKHREEYWVCVFGEGTVQIDESIKSIKAGDTLFIPKGSMHRLENTSDHQSLFISEIQLGDYFGEDDIIRFDDDYNRK